jgi:hypothetical protein
MVLSSNDIFIEKLRSSHMYVKCAGKALAAFYFLRYNLVLEIEH